MVQREPAVIKQQGSMAGLHSKDSIFMNPWNEGVSALLFFWGQVEEEIFFIQK